MADIQHIGRTVRWCCAGHRLKPEQRAKLKLELRTSWGEGLGFAAFGADVADDGSEVVAAVDAEGFEHADGEVEGAVGAAGVAGGEVLFVLALGAADVEGEGQVVAAGRCRVTNGDGAGAGRFYLNCEAINVFTLSIVPKARP